jgi:hypothetical protein
LPGDLFKTETNRAIIFDLEDEVAKEEFKECIWLARTYHFVKRLPLLAK